MAVLNSGTKENMYELLGKSNSETKTLKECHVEANDLIKQKGSNKIKNITARINTAVYYFYKNEFSFPTSQIIESGLIYFLKMDAEKKIKFLIENSEDNSKYCEIKTDAKSLDEALKKFLKNNTIPSVVYEKLSTQQMIDIASDIYKSQK